MPEKYAADFETTTIEPVRVWAWGAARIDDTDIYDCGDDIDSFFEWMQTVKNPIIYFHNEKFDGSFILYYLLTHGYKWKRKKADCKENEFTTIIDDMGKFYAIEIYWKRAGKTVKKATIYDSLKLIPMSIDVAAKKFGLKMQKLHIDYDRHNTARDITAEEWEYLEHDVKIAAQLLQIMFDHGLTKMTLAGCSFNDFKQSFPKYEKYFPVLSYEMDAEIRRAYRGGWTYCNPENAGRDVGAGIVFDVNSLYPSQMHDRPLPKGKPRYFRGKYEKNAHYPLYIQHLWADFEIKPGFLPMIQLKTCPAFQPTEYITSTHGRLVELYLPSPDLELFLKHYNINEIYYTDGYMFMAENGIFEHWVDRWIAQKIQAEKDGNSALRQISKLILNSCYGKFGTNPKRRSKYPVLDTINDKVAFKPIMNVCTDMYGNPILDENGNEQVTAYELTPPKYVPIAVFVTAWARYTTITAAQAIHGKSIAETGRSRFCYADTDSIHLIGTDIPDNIDIDPYRLGAWKHESTFTRAKFLNAKRYIEEIDGQLNVKCAGLPANCHEQVTFENFEIGAEYTGKLQPKQVSGGVLLSETKFQMKEVKKKNEK